MSIRMIGTTPTGDAYLYHSSPSLGEHFFVGKVRRDSKATYLTCHLCDAVTSIPRSDANADHREMQALIDAGKVTPLVHPETLRAGGDPSKPRDLESQPLDPLAVAREDGVAGIPAVIPQTTAARIALRNTLKAAHKDRRPAGSRFQKRIGDVLEVHEDDGTGKTAIRERYRVHPDTRLERV